MSIQAKHLQEDLEQKQKQIHRQSEEIHELRLKMISLQNENSTLTQKLQLQEAQLNQK